MMTCPFVDRLFLLSTLPDFVRSFQVFAVQPDGLVLAAHEVVLMHDQGIAIPGLGMDNAIRRKCQTHPATGNRGRAERLSLWGMPLPSRATQQEAVHIG